MNEEGKIDLFEPGTLVFFIMAFFADLTLLGLIGLAIPGIGLAIAMFVFMAHWGFGLIILFYFWGKTGGWLPKSILLLFWILPLPLMLGLILMVVTSSKIGEFVVEQVAIQAVAIGTAGAGEALEAGAVVAEGAEVATTAAEGVEAAGAVAESTGAVGAAGAEAGGATAEAGAQGIEAGTQGAETAAEAGETQEGLDLTREERNPMENLEEDITLPQEDEFRESPEEQGSEQNEEPEEKKADKAKRQVQKVFDIADRTNNQNKDEGNDESENGDEEEESDKAA